VQALDRLLSAPGDRRRLGAANQQRARETFDQRAMIATYDGLFAAMTGAAGAAAAGTSPAV
jgi:hypothetical protein